MALHNVSASDMGANQTIGSIGSAIPPIPTQQSHYATPNLGSAVSSSMHLTNSSHDGDVLGATSNYKTEHDMMYYSVWMRKTLSRCYRIQILFVEIKNHPIEIAQFIITLQSYRMKFQPAS